MAYQYYNIQLNNTPIPSTEIKNDLQASINEYFEIASDYYTVEYETATPNVFVNIGVRLEAAFNIKVQSNVKDDYKHIIFKNFNTQPSLGDYFRFDGYYWIVIDTGKSKSATNSVMVRRCGDYLRFYDELGVYHKLPCIVEKTVMYDLSTNSYIGIPDNQTRILVKYNAESKKIKFADLSDSNNKYTRFILEEYPYRVVSIDRHTYVRLGVGFIDIRCQSDQINTYDDLINNIADTNFANQTSTPTTGYDIQFNPIFSNIKIGETKTTNVTFTNNSTPITDTPTWTIMQTDGITPSTKATIVSSTNSSVVIKAVNDTANINSQFRIYCNGTNITKYITVTIKSLFYGGAE